MFLKSIVVVIVVVVVEETSSCRERGLVLACKQVDERICVKIKELCCCSSLDTAASIKTAKQNRSFCFVLVACSRAFCDLLVWRRVWYTNAAIQSALS